MHRVDARLQLHPGRGVARSETAQIDYGSVVLEYNYGDRTERGRGVTCSVVGAMSATRSVVDTASTMYDANPGAPRPFRNGAMESDRP